LTSKPKLERVTCMGTYLLREQTATAVGSGTCSLSVSAERRLCALICIRHADITNITKCVVLC
jgi:hypothetical protein